MIAHDSETKEILRKITGETLWLNLLNVTRQKKKIKTG